MATSYKFYKSTIIPKKDEIDAETSLLVSEKGIKNYVDDNHGGLLYPVPSGVIVTGNMYGLEFGMDSDSPTDTVYVKAGMCYDSTNTVQMTLASGTTVSITAGNPSVLYHLFLCYDGTDTEVKFASNEDGSDLTSWDYKRWLGFIRTNSSGEICAFTFNGDAIRWHKAKENYLVKNIGNTSLYGPVDHSDMIPVDRVSMIIYSAGFSGTSNPLVVKDSSGNVLYFVSQTKAISESNTNNGSWGNESHQKMGFMPFDKDVYFQAGGTSVDILIHAVMIKR